MSSAGVRSRCASASSKSNNAVAMQSTNTWCSAVARKSSSAG
jgi:hypothetical protein